MDRRKTMDGDWTTWDGLSKENHAEPEARWNVNAPQLQANKSAERTVGRRTSTRGQPPTAKLALEKRSAIEKKKRSPRGAGLMKKAMPQPEPEAEDEADEADEEYIVDSKNPFEPLGALMEAEANAARATAEQRAEVAKKVVAAPVAKRTRNTLGKLWSQTMNHVLKAVTPMLCALQPN
jgi:hypothetical protein